MNQKEMEREMFRIIALNIIEGEDWTAEAWEHTLIDGFPTVAQRNRIIRARHAVIDRIYKLAGY